MSVDTRHPTKRHRESLTFNERVMLKIASVLGSPYTFYAFCALALSSAPSAIATGNFLTVVSWISQTFIQLTALAALQAAANLMSRHDQMAADHQYGVNMRTMRNLSRLLRHFDLDPDEE